MTDEKHRLFDPSGSRACYTAKYADHLAQENSEALSYIPSPRLEEYARNGQILMAHENGEPCGFLIWGAGWPVMRVYQACIQYDARRREHGYTLVKRLLAIAEKRGVDSIMLRCANDLDSNEFWKAAGFTFAGQVPGGERRGRMLNIWRFTMPNPKQLRLAV
jgi:ribosomal protein S18 acetylase RimI-like enzyme